MLLKIGKFLVWACVWLFSPSADVIAHAQEATRSDTFYGSVSLPTSMRGKVYFGASAPSSPGLGGIFEYDPTAAPGRPRGRLRRLPTNEAYIEAVTDEAIYYAGAEDSLIAFSGFDRPVRTIPAAFPPPWITGERDGRVCVAGYQSLRWAHCPRTQELLGTTGGIRFPTVFDGQLFYVIERGSFWFELWTTDGRTPRMIREFDDGWLREPAVVNDVLFVNFVPRNFGSDKQTWRLTAGDHDFRHEPSLWLDVDSGIQVGSLLFLPGFDADHGWELWRTDGSLSGTRMVADIAPGTRSADLGEFTLHQGSVYFEALGAEGRELWRSDGTADGTRLVRDIHRRGDTRPSNLIAASDRVYFRAYDGLHGTSKLWTTDGTEAGTWMLDVEPRFGGSVIDDAFYFAGVDRLWPPSLWRARAGRLEHLLAPRLDVPIAVDGNPSEWTESYEQKSLSDPTGDVDPSDPIDFRRAAATADGSILYLRYETVGPIDFTQHAEHLQVFFDADRASDTGYRGDDPAFALGAEYLLQGDTLLRYTGRGADWTWTPLGRATTASVGNQLELSLETSAIDGLDPIGSRLLFRADNPITDDYVAQP